MGAKKQWTTKEKLAIVVHVSLESKNSLDLNTVRNNVKMVRF